MREQPQRSRGAIFSAAALFFLFPFSSLAQTPTPARITAAIDETRLVALQGNTHPLARPEFDRGPAPASLPMQRMLLVLTRSPQQETALETLIEQQQDAGSPNFHSWLTPQQFGQQFGPADQDIQAITSWLQSHGFQVARISNGRTAIEFSGTAEQVQEAFHTSIHQYSVNGEQHWANSSDPQIPAALASVVAGVNTLYNFPRQPLYHVGSTVTRSTATGELRSAEPLFTFGNGACGVPGLACYGVSPYDFATIYNSLPLWNATPAIDGTGETIAIVGESDITLQDVADFRQYFGLPASVPQVIVDGPDPGIVSGDETESTLDVEWSGAVAKGATIDFVISQTTEASLGVDLSAQYVVDNNLAPIVSVSYGICEQFLGTAGNQFFNQLWQQAAAQGITALVATGDSGSAVCDRNAGTKGAADLGLSVSGFSSTPYNVAVGGTDFNDLTDVLKYWSPTNTPPPGNPSLPPSLSALQYIPETTWNDTCTNAVFGNLLGYSNNPETNCNNSQLVNFVRTEAGSGGKSSCSSSSGQQLSDCTGGYSKPAWQTALTPADGARDVPDVSLYAAIGGPSGAFYLLCEADLVPTGDSSCLTTDPATEFIEIGGTSASTPAFAGIMAMVDQKTGVRQGNANPILYKLAAQTGASCNSSNGAGSGCSFYDVTNGTIAMPCVVGSPNCIVSNGGDSIGVLSGYSTTSGFDLATGLGSVNANNLVTKWKNFALTTSSTTLTLNNNNAVSITHGQSVPVSISVGPQSGSGTPTGSVSLIANEGPNGTAGGSDGVQGFALSSGSASGSTNALPGGTYTVFANYGGDGTFASSTSSPPISVTVTPENSSANLQLDLFNIATGKLMSSNVTTAPYGSLELLRMNVTSQTGDTCVNNAQGAQGCPTGNVTVANNGASLDAGTYTLNVDGYAEDQTVQLPGGTNVLSLNYAGDNSFKTTSGTSTIIVTQAPTNASVSGSTSVVFGSSATFFVSINTTGIGAAPTGSLTLFSGATQVGGPISVNGVAGSLSNPNPSAQASLSTSQLTLGSNNVTAHYSGDANYAASTSAMFNVDAQIATTCAVTSSNPTIIHGSSVTFTAQIAPTQPGGPGPTGTATFAYDTGTLGTVSVVNGQAQITTSSLPGGSQLIYVQYSGDTDYSASVGSVVETVNLLMTTTSVSSSSSTVTQGQSVTLTSAVAPTQSGGPAPTGTVQFGYITGIDFFAIGTAPLVSGQAQMMTTSLPVGSDQLQAVYSGDANYAGSGSPSITVTVNAAPSFSISANPTTVTISSPGQSGSTTLTFTAQNGFTSNGNVTITPTCTSLPSEASCASGVSVNIPANGSATAQLTFNTTAASALAPASRNRPDAFSKWTMAELVSLACLLSLIVACSRLRGQKRRAWGLAAFLIMCGIAAVAAGCGGGSGGGGGGGNPGTPAGTTNPTVSVTINGVTESVNLTLSVQ